MSRVDEAMERVIAAVKVARSRVADMPKETPEDCTERLAVFMSALDYERRFLELEREPEA